MCGITGQIFFNQNREVETKSFYQSHLLLKHRGPDDEGFVGLGSDGSFRSFRGEDTVSPLKRYPHIISNGKGLRGIFGHRRLSIIDLSEKGHQPMGGDESQVWALFNGEIYNHVELRDQLQGFGVRFKSQSDTEVLLEAYKAWGEACVEKLDGMWAFVVIDGRSKTILFSRDRSGMKPLYYYVDEHQFLCASEVRFIRSIIPSHSFSSSVAFRYLHHSYLNSTRETLFDGIHQLLPAESMVLNYENQQMKFQTYWNPFASNKAPVEKEMDENRLMQKLVYGLKIHLRSDVPLGVSLSGGLDSTGLVCLMNKYFHDDFDPIRTFSVVYEEPEFNEKENIEATCGVIGSRHTWVKATLNSFMDGFKTFLYFQEFPVRSLSPYAHFQLMEEVSRHKIKVILGGHGADEMFGGYSYYNAYLMAEYFRSWNLKKAIDECWTSGLRKGPLLWASLKLLVHHWTSYAFKGRRRGVFKDASPLKPSMIEGMDRNLLCEIMFEDFRFNALPEYLHYEDRNSMAFSLESRLPYLGKEILDVAFHLPNDQKISRGVRKSLLRQTMKDVVPSVVYHDKVKKGFIIPQSIWQRRELKPMIEDVMFSNMIEKISLFDPHRIRRYYKSYINGAHDDWETIWRIFCFSYWHENVLKTDPKGDVPL